MLKPIAIVARKEVMDHARDMRSISASLVYLLMGPLMILLVSFSPSMKANPKAASVLAGMISIFALIAPFVGGMNVAMDMVAGERERRSLLPLLLTPVSRSTIAIGKWFATSVFSLGGLAITLLAFMAVDGVVGISNPLFSRPTLLRWDLLALVPLALFAAALQIAISTICRSAKEAQTYLSLLIFLPVGISMFLVFSPNKIGTWAVFVPIAGQQVLAQAGINTGHWSLPHAVLLALMTGWFTAVAVIGAGKLLEQDSVVYGS